MKIPLYKTLNDVTDVEAVTRIIKRGMYWAGGSENLDFEKAVAQYVGAKHGVSFNSGTSALNALMVTYGLGPGDEVIVPSFTYPPTVDAVRYVGATPVFADIEEKQYGLDPVDVKSRITDRTKAIIAVHVYGLPCRISDLSKVAKNNGLLLIEDAAEALGAEEYGKKLGAFGDASIFSFAGNKIISTGEGGMAVTNSENIRERLNVVKQSHSWRMSTILASLGLSQFTKIEYLIQLRRLRARYLTKALNQIEGVTPPVEPRGLRHIYQFYTIKVEDRDGLKQHLEQLGISTKIYFKPIMRGLPVTDAVAEQVLTLPLYPGLRVREMEYMVEAIKEYVTDEVSMRL